MNLSDETSKFLLELISTYKKLSDAKKLHYLDWLRSQDDIEGVGALANLLENF